MEIYKEHAKYKDIELTEDQYNKLIGIPEPGNRIEIVWSIGITDYGYIFSLPECDIDYDFFVHVPNPDNSSGIGDVPPEWKHINNLLSNDLVEKIIVTPTEQTK